MKRILFPLRLSRLTPFLSVIRSNNYKKKTRAKENLFLGIELNFEINRSDADVRFLSRIEIGRILEISKEKLIKKKKKREKGGE